MGNYNLKTVFFIKTFLEALENPHKIIISIDEMGIGNNIYFIL